MRVALVLLAIGHVLWAGGPLMRRLLPALPAADAWVLGPPTALSLATWLLAWIGLLPGQPLASWGPVVVWALVAGAGHLAARRGDAPDISMPREASSWFAWALLAAFTAGAGYTALALPASHWDFLGRYGRQALILHHHGALTPEVHGYPPLVPLFAAATYAGLGTVDEGLAKLQSVLYGLALLALTYRLALRPGRPWSARVAVLAVGLAPIVLNAPPCGDPDLALAFHANACLFLLLYAGPDAAVPFACGLQLGLALWAKQAAAPFAGSLVALAVLVAAGWLAHGWLTAPRLAVALGVGGALVAPWYLRNLSLTGYLSELANAADSLDADRGIASLFLVRWHEEVGVLGVAVFAVGLAALVARALAQAPDRPRISSRWLALAALALAAAGVALHKPPFDRDAQVFGALSAVALALANRPVGLEPRAAITCVFVLPMLLVWWARFSFTARYLIPVFPPLAVAGARALAPHFRAREPAWAVLLPALALATYDGAPVYRATLAQAVAARALTREERFTKIYPGAVARVGARLRAEAPGARIGTNDSRLGYFVDLARPPVPLSRDVALLDVVVVGPYGEGMGATPAEIASSVADWRARLGEPWFTDSDYAVYRVRR